MYNSAEVKQHISQNELKKLQEVDQVRTVERPNFNDTDNYQHYCFCRYNMLQFLSFLTQKKNVAVVREGIFHYAHKIPFITLNS